MGSISEENGLESTTLDSLERREYSTSSNPCSYTAYQAEPYQGGSSKIKHRVHRRRSQTDSEGPQCYEGRKLKKVKFSAYEDKVILSTVRELGIKWSEIAKRLPGRTEQMIKNRYYTKLKKQLAEQDAQSSEALPELGLVSRQSHASFEVTGENEDSTPNQI